MSSCPTLSVTESAVALPHSPHWFLNGWSLSLVQAIHSGLRGCKRGMIALVSSVWVLLISKTLIGCVSAFDTYLTIKYAESLDVYEQNPLGRWLMGLDNGPVCDMQQIAAFITAKFLGTLLVLIIIQGLAYWRVRVAGMVATPVCLAQLYLAVHLISGNG